MSGYKGYKQLIFSKLLKSYAEQVLQKMFACDTTAHELLRYGDFYHEPSVTKKLCTESNEPTASSDNERYSGILGCHLLTFSLSILNSMIIINQCMVHYNIHTTLHYRHYLGHICPMDR